MPEKLNEELFLTASSIAELFGKAESTIREWALKCEARRVRKGRVVKFFLPDIYKFHCDRICKLSVANSIDKNRLELEEKRLKVRKMRLELEEKEGKLIDRDEVEREWAQRASALRTGLIGLVYRLTGVLAGRKWSRPELIKVLMKEIHAILKLYAQEGKFTPYVFDMPFERFEYAYRQFWNGISKVDCDKPRVKVECPKRRRKK